jgi:hypothetical protein
MEELEMIKRKLISLLLAAVMIAAMVPAMAVGATNTPPIDAMNAMDIWFCQVNETLGNGWNADGVIFYSLGFNQARSDRATWFPLFGDLDVSRLIPRRAPQTGREYRIAFATKESLGDVMGKVLDTASITSLQNSGDLAVVELGPRTFTAVPGIPTPNDRPRMDRDFTVASLSSLVDTPNTDFEWHIKAGRNARWALVAPETDLRPTVFPMGAALEIKQFNTAATATSIVPSSAPLRLRVAAIPRAPRAAITFRAGRTGNNATSATSIININEKMEYIVTTAAALADATFDAIYNGDDGWTWRSDNKSKTMTLVASNATSNVPDRLWATAPAGTTPGVSIAAGDIILVRNRATARAPASMYAEVLVTPALLTGPTS